MVKTVKVLMVLALLAGASSMATAARHRVLCEDFTGLWCTYCPGAQMGLEDAKIAYGDTIVCVAYHSSDSLDFGSLYAARGKIYKMSGIPAVYFDGVDSVIGGSHTVSQIAAYRPKINARKVLSSDLIFRYISGSYNSTTKAGTVTFLVKNLGASSLSFNLHFMVLDKQIAVNWQDQNHANHVVRSALPDTNGEAITLAAGAKAEVTITRNYSLSNLRNPTNSEFIIFAQKNNTPNFRTVFNAAEGNATIPSTLGVELTDFTGMSSNGEVTLSWRTASEDNTYAWVIDRSTEPDNGFVRVASLPAHTNTTGEQNYTHTDRTAAANTDYFYRLGDQDLQGNITWRGSVLVTSKGRVVSSVDLAPCRPNPCRGDVSLSYALPKAGEVTLNVYDIGGRLVRSLESGTRNAGSHQAPWDLRDNSGRKVSNGIYIYRLIAGDQARTQKLTVIR